MSFDPSSGGGDVDAYLADLRAEFGGFEVREHTVEVSRELLADTAAVAEQDALGGARVVLENDGEFLLVQVNEGDSWDAPGGNRQPYETHASTARRGLHARTRLECALTTVHLVHRYEFTLVEGTGGETGLWVLFGGETADPTIDLADDVHDAGWFATPPDGVAEDVLEVLRSDGEG